jgi:hypothetical protein
VVKNPDQKTIEKKSLLANDSKLQLTIAEKLRQELRHDIHRPKKKKKTKKKKKKTESQVCPSCLLARLLTGC